MCSTPTETAQTETRTFRRAEREAIARALDVVLASNRFESSPQMSAFIRFVVEQTLAGHQNRIKAFTVAVDALGKADSFDAQNDPLVRVLAGRLRTALADYHEENPDSSVQISMAPGSYVPSFRFAAKRSKKQTRPVAPDRPISVVNVKGPAVFVSGVDTQLALENSLNSLVSGVVAQCPTANAYRLLSSTPEAAFQNHDYLFSLKSMSLTDSVRICMQLLKARTGRIIDAGQADLSKTAKELLSSEDLDLVVAAVQAMLQPDSPLLNDYAADCS